MKNKLSYDLYYKNKYKGKVILNSIVDKNVENSLACFLVCKHFHIDEKYFFAAMKKFKGTKRRMEVLSLNPLVIEDYAHHPSELKTVIESVKRHYLDDNLNKKLIVIFQPHTYTRTQAFFKDFVKVLSKPDFVGILETFSARENIIQGARGFDLYKALKAKFEFSSKHAMYFQNIYEVKNYTSSLPKNTIVLYLGAGESLAKQFLIQKK
jgi:UDP-N-acetylmuramate--alanine ligase